MIVYQLIYLVVGSGTSGSGGGGAMTAPVATDTMGGLDCGGGGVQGGGAEVSGGGIC